MAHMVNRKLPATADDAGAKDEAAAERYRAPALDKGLDILELLAATDTGLSQAEIAKALQRTANEIYRMLDRLVRRGYVRRDQGERYELSLKLFALAHQHAPLRRLVAQAMPIMRQFVRDAGQSCHLAIYDRGGVVVIAQLDAPGYWGLAIRVGARVGLLDTGSGHVLLAFQTPQERGFMLAEREVGPSDPPLPPDLEERLGKVRERGGEIMPSRQTRGVLNLSAPVFGGDRSAIAAFTCPFIERIDSRAAPDAHGVTALVLAAARALSLSAAGSS
jgi:DNA-binding IclR family transcriptional regulator